MDATLTLLFGILLGAILTAAVGAWFWRLYHAERARRASAAESAVRERESSIRAEISERLELDFSRRQMDLEQEVNGRLLDLKAKEEEAVSTLVAAEKERDMLEKRRTELDARLASFQEAEDRLLHLQSTYRRSLQDISGMSPDAARARLIEETRKECEVELRSYKDDWLRRSEREVQVEARRILIDTMQRMAASPNRDMTATFVALPGEDMKGRIIGREGRNIKCFESFTGTTLLIDETPDSVLVSSFDPVRREVARIALETLIRDGRIHPASIEQAVRTAEADVQHAVVAAGEEALRRLRLGTMHPEVLTLVGKLRFRFSYNQNALDHSVEVAQLCALMAAELGLDATIAKRAGLLHDIGKALDQDHEGGHAHAGAYFLKRCGGEDHRVINAVAAHHGEVSAESPYVALVMLADSISALRPGARSDSLDGYIQRVRNLEALARETSGVVDAYAIQAGREVRVIVSPEQVSDGEAAMIARRLRRRIEDELQYPGTIRITVIREQRFSEVAK
jgi:ribonuclease Y